MPLSIVSLGSHRHPDEGLRIGTVRRPPRGVPKAEFASQNWYDLWCPNLAPSAQRTKQSESLAFAHFSFCGLTSKLSGDALAQRPA
jgi:uncharacterized protein YeaO (DUF488 family)